MDTQERRYVWFGKARNNYNFNFIDRPLWLLLLLGLTKPKHNTFLLGVFIYRKSFVHQMQQYNKTKPMVGIESTCVLWAIFCSFVYK